MRYAWRMLPLGFMAILISCPLPAPAAPAKKAERLYGRASETGLMALRRQLGYEISGAQAVASIGQVKLGTAAAFAGIQPGDIVLKEQVGKEAIDLTFKRAGRVYQARLAAGPKRKPLPLASGAQPTVRQPPVRLSVAEVPLVLAKQQVVLVIDKSGSMDARDCPGGKSRWQWCVDQAAALKRETADCLKDGFTLSVFSDNHTTIPVASVDAVERVLRENAPGGSTQMTPPIQEQLDAYFARPSRDEKALLIAVITDGHPTDGDELIRTLIAASEKAKPVKVCFLQVGEGVPGAEFLSFIDDELTGCGAARDIVDARSFAELCRLGLRQVIAEAVKEQEGPSTVRVPSPALRQDSTPTLYEAQQDRRRIEQMLLKMYAPKE